MGEFKGIAEGIARRIAAVEGGVTPDALAEIGVEVSTAAGFGPYINCYPGTPSNACCPLALFISLSAQGYARKRRGQPHLSFAEALDCLVAHMTGECSGITRHAVLVTDSWDGTAWMKWHNTVKNLRQNATIEIYLITGEGAVTEIDF